MKLNRKVVAVLTAVSLITAGNGSTATAANAPSAAKKLVITKGSYGVETLSNLDVSNNTSLSSLDCQDNNQSSFDVSSNPGLKKLHCSQNQLTSLDLASCFSGVRRARIQVDEGTEILNKPANVTISYYSPEDDEEE